MPDCSKSTCLFLARRLPLLALCLSAVLLVLLQPLPLFAQQATPAPSGGLAAPPPSPPAKPSSTAVPVDNAGTPAPRVELPADAAEAGAAPEPLMNREGQPMPAEPQGWPTPGELAGDMVFPAGMEEGWSEAAAEGLVTEPGIGGAREALATAPLETEGVAKEIASTQGEGKEESQQTTLELLDEDARLDTDGAGREADALEDAPHTAAAPAPSQEEDGGGLQAILEIELDGAHPDDTGADEALTRLDEAAPPPQDGEALFPSSPGIDRQKEFWIQIFTRYHSQQGVLHDGRIAHPVYEELDLTGMKYRVQRRHIRHRKRALRIQLRELAAALESGDSLNDEQRALLAKLPAGSDPRAMRDFANKVRFQRGLADRFERGLIRSGALMKIMRQAMARHGVPPDLVYLPHVESSFNNGTRSRVGATGIWQFTRGTGRLFMKVGYVVDQRLDPVVASEAAAKFLRQNYDKLGTWPLAITAYNHGPRGIMLITERMGSKDLDVLIRNYDGPLFKFASRNFYAEFLAAREVALNHERYFGPLELDPPLEYDSVKLPFFVSAKAVARQLGISREALRKLNTALRVAVWSGGKRIPAGFQLRIPKGTDGKKFLASIPESARFDKQKRTAVVRVRRGDTLYSIGRRFRIPWRRIALANNISSVRRLRPGMRLILPWDGTMPRAADLIAEREAPVTRRKAAAPRVVERIPYSGENAREHVAASRHHSAKFQELRVLTYDVTHREGEIVAAYGETMGLYAEWAGVTVRELRRLNYRYRRRKLRPGRKIMIAMDAVSPEDFFQRRMAYHQQREKSFFAEYNITEMVRVEVKPGQSPWALAQNNNVPMWLFYRENPELLQKPMRAGMRVVLPVVRLDIAPGTGETVLR